MCPAGCSLSIGSNPSSMNGNHPRGRAPTPSLVPIELTIRKRRLQF
jgi:hypothetical protein